MGTQAGPFLTAHKADAASDGGPKGMVSHLHASTQEEEEGGEEGGEEEPKPYAALVVSTWSKREKNFIYRSA